MDHKTAASSHATERYLLGEMPADERETFEHHLLSCNICADDMHLTAMFIENAKVVLQERSLQPLAAPHHGWRTWLRVQIAIPALAAAALVLIAGYQNLVVIPQLRTPRVLPAAVILDGETRSGLPQVISRKGLRFQIAVDLPPSIERLRAELIDQAGKPVWSDMIDSPGPNQALDVYFPNKLSPGRYRLVIRPVQGGGVGPELAHSDFQIIKQGE
jgi:hypothetical protein